jgi:hypothetical protein
MENAMTIDQMRVVLAEFKKFMEGKGHGILLTMKNGEQIAGDFAAVDNKDANPLPGLFRVQRYISPANHAPNKLNPLTFVEIGEIATATIVDFSGSTGI